MERAAFLCFDFVIFVSFVVHKLVDGFSMPIVSRTLTLLLFAASGLTAQAQAQSPVSFDQKAGSLSIQIDGRPLATYVWNDPAVLRPYFAHLHAPNGKQVTRNHPPRRGPDATDHADDAPRPVAGFRRSLRRRLLAQQGRPSSTWSSCTSPQASAGGGSFVVRNRYDAGGKTLCEEDCRISIRQQPGGTLIDWASEFSGPEEFTFGDQEEMGLGVRVATPLTVKNGGQILNSDGLKNEKQVWGKQADWCDYSGVIDGEPVGVAIFPSPQNFRRSWFHARDYGVLVANPFGQNAFTKGEKSKVVVPQGRRSGCGSAFSSTRARSIWLPRTRTGCRRIDLRSKRAPFVILRVSHD